jgi:hypothetical protein
MSVLFFRLLKFKPWQRIMQFPQAGGVGNVVSGAGEADGSCLVLGGGVAVVPVASGGSARRSQRPAKKATQASRPFQVVGGTGFARGTSTAVADRRAQLTLVLAPVIAESVGLAAGSAQVRGASAPWELTEAEEAELILILDLLLAA